MIDSLTDLNMKVKQTSSSSLILEIQRPTAVVTTAYSFLKGIYTSQNGIS